MYLDRTFLATALLSAHELYQYADETDPANVVIRSAECLGGCWGNHCVEDDTFVVVFASVTQLVEERDETHVVGPEPLAHAVHAAWAGLELGDVNLIGAFHSHPWTQAELDTDGLSDEARWTVSDSDMDSMAIGQIEIILSLRPLTSVPETQHPWAHRGLLVSGQHDTNHVTVSAWHKGKDERVTQIQVHVPDVARLNRGIERIDRC